MKKTLFLYIAREMLLNFLICFLFFFLIFFVNQILLMAEEILSKRAPFRDVFLLIVYALPSIIATSAPFSALVGTLMGIGRLVSDREVLSMNTLGVSLRFILVPVLSVGVLISIVSFLTNDILLPIGTIRFNRLYRKILTSTPALEIEGNSIKRSQRAIVVTGDVKNSVMDSLLVIDSDEDGNKRVIASPEARIVKSDDMDILMTLAMDDADVVVFNRKDKEKFDLIKSESISYNLLSKNVIPAFSGRITPREMSSLDLYREIKKRQTQQDKKDETRSLNMYRTEFHKKFTIPFGAFFFVILAFPLGLTAKTNGQSVGFIVGLLIAVFYWAMLIGGQTLSLKLGFNGAVMMWLPNTVILAMGVMFMGRNFFK